MELLELGDWHHLRPGMNVLWVADAEAHRQLIARLGAALGGSFGDPGPARARVSGTELSLDADVRGALQSALGQLSVVIGAAAAPAAAVDPSVVTIRSALEVDRALANPGDRPAPPSPEAIQRLEMIETKAASQATAHIDVIETDLNRIQHGLLELVQWRDGLVRGYARIDEAHAAVVATEDDTRKRMAGPAAFNKHLDAKAARDKIVKEVGFANFDVYVAEAKHVMDDAAQRIALQEADLAAAQQRVFVERGKTLGPVHAETELLSMHVRFDTRVSQTEQDSVRHRNLIRRSLRSPMAVLLRHMSIDPGEDALVTAAQWLDNQQRASAQAADRVLVELAIQGRLHSLASVPTLGPVPLVLDSPLAGLNGPDAQAVFGNLVDVAQRGHQMLYICTEQEATRVSPLAHLFMRVPSMI